MLAQERHDTIFRVLTEKNTIKVSEVMDLCGVSHETARRDLEIMQENGLARRVHGGAVLIPQNPSENNNGKSKHQFRVENMVAAKAASQLVYPGDTILVDNGRTMEQLARYLGELSELSVLTPSLSVINELVGTKNKVVSLGGELLHEENCFIGALPQSALSSYNVDKAFLSCAGLQLKRGYLTDYDTYGLSRHLIREHAAHMILVMNSEKLRTNAFVNVFPLSGIDTIVVDSYILPEEEEFIRNKGIELIIAPMPDEDAITEVATAERS